MKFISILLALVLGFSTAQASTVEDFYKGNTVTVIIRTNADGGSNDTYGRLLARYIGKHIPGNPNVIVQNMPGGGGLIAANYTQHRAKKDGTEFTLFAQGAVIEQRKKTNGVDYDVQSWNLIGSMAGGSSAYVVHKDSPINSIADIFSAKEVKVSASGPGSSSYTTSSLLGKMGANIKFILGYDKTSTKVLAVLRKDVDMTNGTYGSIMKRVKKNADMKLIGILGNIDENPQVDRLENYVTPENQTVFDLMTVGVTAGVPFALPPGVPSERVQAVRDAFKATLKDADFLAEAEKLKRPIAYTAPEKMAKLYQTVLSASDEDMAKVE